MPGLAWVKVTFDRQRIILAEHGQPETFMLV